MSAKGLVWAMRHSAWCKNAGELAALMAVANFVKEDLTGCWASQRVLAEKARVTDRTMRTHLRALAERSVIVPGDESLVAHLPADNRPDVWNLNRELPTAPGTGKDFRSPKGTTTGKFRSDRPEKSSDDPVMVDPGSSGGDGHGPPTGGRGRSRRGKAASSKDALVRKVATADLRRVMERIPGPLAARLDVEFAHGLPAAVNEAVARVLVEEQRTVEQLVARLERRWVQWSYEDDAIALSGQGLDRPLGVLLTLLGPSSCWGNNPRCEDGTDIDTEAVCPRCEEARADKAAERRPPDQALDGYSVTFERPADGEPSPYVECVGAGCGMKMLPTPDGLCRECREDQQV